MPFSTPETYSSSQQSAYAAKTQRLHFATCQAIIYRSTAPLREKAFLQILATWADDHGQCFPSNEQIRKRANTPLSERTIQNLIGRCVALGELRVALNASVRQTNIYTILCTRPDYAPRLPREKPPAKRRKGGAKPKPKVAPEVKQESLSTSVPVPIPVPIPEEIHQSGEGNNHVSKPLQTAVKPDPAVSSPIEITVLKTGTEEPSAEQRASWARWFHQVVRPEAYRLRLPLSKGQVRMLRSRMNHGVLPWPKPGSWLANQMRRPV